MIIHKIAKKTGKHTLLLICLLIALVLYPLLEESEIGSMGLNLWCIITMLTLALSLQDEKRHYRATMVSGGILSLLMVGAFVLQVMKSDSLLIYHFILPGSILFLSYIIWIIISSIFKRNELGRDELCGSIVSYLLLGITWALMYSYIELVAPNSFTFATDGDLQAKGSALFYYSFVTLTTLGYGDILPVSEFARMVAYLEAVTGVMYTAILVAGLVGNIGNKKKQGN